MAPAAAVHPFQFMACWELREMLGVRARDVAELLEAIEEVPLDSIHYHTHSYFLRHRYIPGPYPNDFATWVAMELRDRVLAERLAVVDPFEAENPETLRAQLIAVLDDHLSETSRASRISSGEPFFFSRSRIEAVPAGIRARSLADFCEDLREVDASAIYLHVVEAMSRQDRRQSDFASWIEDSLGLSSLASRVAAVHPYTRSLEVVRNRILEICESELGS